MGARGYRTQKVAARGKVREEKSADQRDTLSIIHRCSRHPKRQSDVWSVFGRARGRHLCDACHDSLVQRGLRDEKFLKVLEASGSSAEAAIDSALKEVA